MAKAFRQIQEKSVIADLFIVVLDGRAPLSTYNEDFDSIFPSKPRLFVITKIDLADSSKFNKIKEKFNNKDDAVIFVNLKKKSSSQKILNKAHEILAKKRERDKKKGIIKTVVRAIVMGVPNSGKSTLINRLSKSNKAKVGNRPGVTRGQQWINAGSIQLLDTPGILWPKFNDQLTGLKLALIGAIKIEIIPKQEVFNAGYKLLNKFYPKKLNDIGFKQASEDNEIYSNLISFCYEKNFLLQKEKPNLNKGMEYFINKLKTIEGVTYD